MILAQSHRQRLNGNNILLLSILIIFFVSSCKIRKGEYYQEDTPATVGGVDTIRWDNKPSDYPPITDNSGSTIVEPVNPVEPQPNPDDKDPDEPDTPVVDPIEETEYSYDVAFMLPFYSNKAGTGQITSSSSLKSLEFYTGAKMALDKLSAEGLNLKVYAYDTQGSSSQVSSIMSRSEFSGMDLVFGPMKTDPLKTAASRVRGKQTVLVSPWNPKTSITSSNPNYIQVSPSLKTHCEAIMKYVRQNHYIGNVVLACKQGTSERNYFTYFQNANKVLAGSTATASIPELEAEYGDNIPLENYYQPDSTVFIVPSWDEKFISNLLRKIAITKGNRKVVVYGLPQWMNFERIDFDYYERLNIHVSSAVFVDAESYEVREFRRDYYNKTGTVPGTDAFLGYDLTLYFGRQLKEKGNSFIRQLDVNPSSQGEYYHTVFQFEGDSPSGTDNFNNIDKFENKHVNILKFDNFGFQHTKQ